jgi:hypothetical protein
MINPGRYDYLSMTSEHNWSLPNISIGLGKNSVKEVIKRGKHLDGGIPYDYEFLKSVHAFKQGGIIKAKGGVKLNNIWAGKN